MTGCLGDDTIAAMLDGRLADASARDARLHIGHCDACRELVAAAIRSPPAATMSGHVPEAAHSSTALGAIFAGRYQIERALGEGGMGRVFEAKQLGLDRKVAIKVLRPELARDAIALARFHREARLAASLDSQHVVRIYDLGVLDTGEPYLVMELLDGEDLGTLVERGPIPLDDATRLIAAACDAIGAAHALGIVHRDLKPSNLFLTRGGRLVVLDFGLAKLSVLGNLAASVTHEGVVVGSPRYIAPEQILGARDVDGRADIWSLGATLYHLITGRPPFPEHNVDALFARILDGGLPPLDGIPPVVANAIARALARDPAARFATAGELALALRATPPDLAQRFEILELLGEGSYGTVYRARSCSGGREVALKVLRGDAHHIRDRFAREAAIVQRLEHPNTVRLYESSIANGTPYMVFELVRGRTLASELYRGPLLPARVARIASQVLKALLEAHALGIVHRDITPSNILLVDYAGDPDFVKLLDFGVAVDTASARLTTAGQVLGTPRYMAPEQVAGGAVDGRTDLYALGLVMAEALSGAPVYRGEHAMAVWMQQASPEPVPLPYAVTAGPFGAVIARATTKQPAARFASAAEMLAAIERGPSAGVAFSASAPAPEVSVHQRPRSRMVGALVASTVVLGATTALLAWRPWAKDDAAAHGTMDGTHERGARDGTTGGARDGTTGGARGDTTGGARDVTGGARDTTGGARGDTTGGARDTAGGARDTTSGARDDMTSGARDRAGGARDDTTSGARDTTSGAHDTRGGARDTASGARDTTGGARDTTAGARDGTTGGARDTTGGARDTTGGARDSTTGTRDGTTGARDGTTGARDGTAGGARDTTGGARNGKGGAPGANLDETRLVARLKKLGWAPVEITRQDLPGCHHTRLRLDAGTFAGERRNWGEVYLLECESAAYAASEGARLRHGFPTSWIVVDGASVLSTSLPPPGEGFATEAASKQLADALLTP